MNDNIPSDLQYKDDLRKQRDNLSFYIRSFFP